MSNQKLELMVGTFIVAGVILIAGMILSVTGFSIWSGSYVVLVSMEHIGDLQVGAPVKRGGVEIGRVTELDLRKKDILVVCEINDKVGLTKDSAARIETAGVVGDTFLEFGQGKDPELWPRFESREMAERNNAYKKGLPQVSMNELLHQLEQIGTEVTSITRNVNEILGDDKVKNDIRDAISNINGITIETKKMLTSLNRAARNVEQASTDIVAMTGKVKKVAGTVEVAVNETIGNKQNREALNETLANVRSLSRELAGKSKQISLAIDNVKSVTEKAKTITDAMGPEKGIFGILTSDKVQKDINDALAYLRDFVSHKGVMTALQLKRYADEIATKRLKEMRSHRIPADELENEILRRLRKGLIGGKEEAQEIIRAEERGY